MRPELWRPDLMRALVIFGMSVVILVLVLVFVDPKDAPRPATEDDQGSHRTNNDR